MSGIELGPGGDDALDGAPRQVGEGAVMGRREGENVAAASDGGGGQENAGEVWVAA